MNSGKAKLRQFTRQHHRWTSTGIGLVSGTLMTYLRRKARERGLDFDVTKEYLWQLFQEQDGKCALTGISLNLSTKIDKNQNVDRTNHTASLDRIDNSLPYIEGNVQWIHKTVNQMRRQYSIEDYIHWCTLVAKHANPEPSSVNGIKVTEKVQRLTGEEPIQYSRHERPTSRTDDDIV